MMNARRNPYRWDGHPEHIIPREELFERVKRELLRGKSGYLVGCRGMGKSVFMGELAKALGSVSDSEVIVLDAPPPERTVTRMIGALVDAFVDAAKESGYHDEALETELRRHEERQSLEKIFNTYLSVAEDIEPLVLLYDELDGYSGRDGTGFFNALEVVRKRSDLRLVVFAAGGIGLVALDTIFGSSFFSRMTPYVLDPFSRDEVVELARPFADDGRPLADEIIDIVLAMSGGNGLMTAFGLEQLWEVEEPKAVDVSQAFARFRDEHDDLIRRIRAPIFMPGDLPRAPEAVWSRLSESGAPLSERELRELVKDNRGGHSIDAKWVLTMLRATGLIRCEDDTYRQPTINVDIIPSLLTLELPARGQGSSLREQLMLDLPRVLAQIHRMSIDFFYEKDTRRKKGSTEKTGPKELKPVPESVFSAIIGISLEFIGWRVDREAQSASGRTDLKATHKLFADTAAVIEVKIWPRNYKDIHEQVTGYWAEGVNALATVMITDVKSETWKDDYAKKCLEGKVESWEERDVSDALAGHFVAKSGKSSTPEVDHLLLRLAKRKK